MAVPPDPAGDGTGPAADLIDPVALEARLDEARGRRAMVLAARAMPTAAPPAASAREPVGRFAGQFVRRPRGRPTSARPRLGRGSPPRSGWRPPPLRLPPPPPPRLAQHRSWSRRRPRSRRPRCRRRSSSRFPPPRPRARCRVRRTTPRRRCADPERTERPGHAAAPRRGQASRPRGQRGDPRPRRRHARPARARRRPGPAAVDDPRPPRPAGWSIPAGGSKGRKRRD